MPVEQPAEFQPSPDGASTVPLAVDLDGTLIRSDLLLESFLGLLRQSTRSVLLVPFWLLKGKAFLKAEIARRVELDATVLPYQPEFLAYLNGQHARGRKLILATASHRKYAEQVAAHVGIFDGVIATEGGDNVSGRRKMEKLVEKYGEDGFDYAGNGRVDLRIWPHARRALLVSPAPGVQAALAGSGKIERVFEDGGGRVVDYLRAMRLYQWVKNVLLFVALVASHQASDLQLGLQCLVAFLAFGLVASSAYVLNDLLDLPADRQHPRKRARPIPAARISIVAALWMVAALLASGLAIALTLPPLFLASLAVYYAGTLAYSFKLKNFAILDVCTLAGLYTLRIVAGAAAIGNWPSFWLLAFSMFVFLSLALVKRYSELMVVARQGRASAGGRGYQVEDLTLLQALGVGSAMAATLVLALYVNNPEITRLYSRPEVIWLLCPLFLYWIGRIWMITHRGDMHDDPVVFTFRDVTSLLVGLLCGIILLIAT